MGNKYIIEIEEAYAPIQRIGTKSELPLIYRVKGFNSLVFDQRGLNQLEKYDPNKMAIDEFRRGYEAGVEASKKEQQEYDDGYNDGYDAGLADAWEAAKKISFPDSEGGIASEDIESVFGYPFWSLVMKYTTPAEAITKIKAYEEKQKAEAEIRVGDEVQISMSRDICRGVVLRVADKRDTKLVSVIQDNGFSIFNTRDYKIEKTGRHFPEVAELLEKMMDGGEKI